MFIIVMNYDQVFDVLILIFDSAFSSDAAKGGFVGVLVQGFRRAAFSNEAGVGSAAIAHSAVKTNEPVTEGIVALLRAIYRYRCYLYDDCYRYYHYRSSYRL